MLRAVKFYASLFACESPILITICLVVNLVLPGVIGSLICHQRQSIESEGKAAEMPTAIPFVGIQI